MGDIIEWTKNALYKSHLVIFITTPNSIVSEDCQLELLLVLENEIDILRGMYNGGLYV